MEFSPVPKSNLTDDLTDRLVQMIRSGVYKPGDRLPAIMQMARSFGVGHPTLREALKKLEVLGLVEIKHGSGVYVRSGRDVLLVSNPVYGGSVSKKLMLDLIDARKPIEVTAVVQAAVHATDAHLAEMDRLLGEASEHLNDDRVLSGINMAFHREIAVASGNSVLAQLQEVLASLFQQEQRMILNIFGSREKDHHEHVGIFDALKARDADLGRARMEAHLQGVHDVLVQWDPEQTPLS